MDMLDRQLMYERLSNTGMSSPAEALKKGSLNGFLTSFLRQFFCNNGRTVAVVAAVLLLLLGGGQGAHAVNLYWVGGSGNWGDVNHWATTSGGSVHPSSLPSPDDVVYFDDNSGWTSS
ncbi:MAG: hypothetical protein LBR84_01220, partial [Tannerella sp.]|nr:hypothetical protein [Tannerella sp.]